MSRYFWLEEQLDRDDLTDEEFDLYNKELNDLQEEINKKKKAGKTEKLQRDQEDREQKELDYINALTEEQVEKMYADCCLKHQDVNGMSFELWYTQSLKYYTIDSQHNVHACARSSNTVEIIPHLSFAHAKLTILNRIKYKFYDHAVRGHEFAYEL